MNIRTSFSGLNGDALASMLNSRSWKYYTPEKRLELLQEVEIRAARSQGRDALVVKTFRTDRDNGSLKGYFMPGRNRALYINENYVCNTPSRLYDYSVSTALRTLLHEGRHAYQNDVINGRCPAPDAQTKQRWKLNGASYFNDASTPENEAIYAQQSMERDARDYAMQELKTIYDMVRNATGCDDFAYQATLNQMRSREQCYYDLAKSMLTRYVMDEIDRKVRAAFERAYPGEKLTVSIFDEFRRDLDRMQEIQIREICKQASDDSPLDRMICEYAERIGLETGRERRDFNKYTDRSFRACTL